MGFRLTVPVGMQVSSFKESGPRMVRAEGVTPLVTLQVYRADTEFDSSSSYYQGACLSRVCQRSYSRGGQSPILSSYQDTVVDGVRYLGSLFRHGGGYELLYTARALGTDFVMSLESSIPLDRYASIRGQLDSLWRGFVFIDTPARYWTTRTPLPNRIQYQAYTQKPLFRLDGRSAPIDLSRQSLYLPR